MADYRNKVKSGLLDSLICQRGTASGSSIKKMTISHSIQSAECTTKKSAFRGVTVLELLVAISSVTLLASILFPAVHAARESTRNLECTNNLRQIGLALHKYHEVNESLPPGWKYEPSRRTAYGWAARILIDLEEPGLAARMDLAKPLDETLASVREKTLAVYVCPSDVGEPTFPLYAEIGKHDEHAQESTQVLVKLPRANYVGVFGTTDPDDVDGTSGNGTFVRQHGRQFKEMTRGLANIVVVGERTTRKLPSTWLGTMTAGEDAHSRLVGFAQKGPNLDDADECEFDSRHTEHVNFLWADGHVGGVRNDIDRNVYQNQAKYR